MQPSNNQGAMLKTIALIGASLFLCICIGLGVGLTGMALMSARVATTPESVTIVDSTSANPDRVLETRTPAAPATAVPDAESSVPADNSPAATGTPSPALTRDRELNPEDLDLLFEVWDHVRENFDGELPTEEELLRALILSALDTLEDEHTNYIPPQTAARMREDSQGTFSGVGAYVRMSEEGQLFIVRPIAGQPAALAGLQAEDIILSADGILLQGMTIDEAISLVRGPSGSTVTLLISRPSLGDADPFEVTIVRQLIQIVTVESQMLEGGIGYVRLAQFNRVASEQLSAAVAELMAQQPRALIFDMRDNGGGFLDQAVEVADIFLPEGVVLYERGSTGIDEVFRSSTGNAAENVQLVVLVNAGSASASELVAGAIQDLGRGVIVGETTFGKGSVQTIRQLSDGAELRVTIARWYTPLDRSIDGIGITPDIESLPSPLEFGGPEDNQLQRAIQFILTGE